MKCVALAIEDGIIPSGAGELKPNPVVNHCEICAIRVLCLDFPSGASYFIL